MSKGKSMIEHMGERNSIQKGPGDPKKKAGPKPIYTSDPKRVKAYNDSMTLYKSSKSGSDAIAKGKSLEESRKNWRDHYKKTRRELGGNNQSFKDLSIYNGRDPEPEKEITKKFPPLVKVTKNSIGIPTDISIEYGQELTSRIYKKPVQPVVLAKKAEKKKTTKTSAKVAAPKTTAKAKSIRKPVEKAKPTSKPVVKAKPVVKKPEKIVMKPVSEEDSNALKAGFKKQTGKEFKSKDSDYNKLQKKLGRKPTVKEYNESLKK